MAGIRTTMGCQCFLATKCAHASEHQRPATNHGWLKTPLGAQWVRVLTHTSTAKHGGEAEIINDYCDDL